MQKNTKKPPDDDTSTRYFFHAFAAICIVFLWGAAANVPLGSTCCFWGFPFLMALFLILRRYRTQTKTIIWLVALLPLVCTLSVDMSRSRLFFPAIGTRIDVPAGWGGVENRHDQARYLKDPESIAFRYAQKYNDARILVFHETTPMTLASVTPEMNGLNPRLSVKVRDAWGADYIIAEEPLLRAIDEGTIGAPTLLHQTTLARKLLLYLSNLMYWPLGPFALITVAPQLLERPELLQTMTTPETITPFVPPVQPSTVAPEPSKPFRLITPEQTNAPSSTMPSQPELELVVPKPN